MKLNVLVAAIVATLGLVSINLANASDGTATFSGTVVAAACTITGGGNVSVTLPPVDAYALSAVGRTAGITPFDILLTGCPATTAVHAYFEVSSSVDMATGNLKNTASANNVQIGLLNASLSAINVATQANNGAGTGTITSGAGTATLSYFAQYVATAAAIAGSVASTVTYSLVYN